MVDKAETTTPTINEMRAPYIKPAEAIAPQFVRADKVFGAGWLFDVGVVGLVGIVRRDLLGKNRRQHKHQQDSNPQQRPPVSNELLKSDKGKGLGPDYLGEFDVWRQFELCSQP